MGILFLIVPFSSDKPGGLEKVSKDPIGFLKKEDFISGPKAPVSDYTIPVRKQRFNKQYAGIIGVVIAFGTMVFMGYVLKRRRNK